MRQVTDVNYSKQQKLQKSKYDEYIEEELEEADKEAEDPNTKYYTHEEMKQMARRIINGE